MPKSLDQMGTLQRRVMEHLWKLGEGSVHDVIDAIAAAETDDEKAPAYTTVLTVLQKLRESGWVESRTEGRSHVFRPTRSREEEGQRTIRGLMDRVFRGDPKVLVQHLLDADDLTERDLGAIRKMIDERLGSTDQPAEGAEGAAR